MIPSLAREELHKGQSPTIDVQLTDPAHDPSKILQSLNEIIQPNSLIFLSTVRGDTPYGCVVVFAYDRNLCIVFFSERGTMHSQNLLKNNKIAGEIASTDQTWESPRRGLQFMGTAHEADKSELSKAVNLYMARYPGFARAKIDPKTQAIETVRVTPYIIRPTYLKIFDEKIFGRETWVEVKLPNQCALTDEV